MDRDSAGLTGDVLGSTTPRDKQIRVFYLSYTPPVPTWGGAMAFYRHFVERSDFDLLVATDSMQVERYDLPYAFLRFNAPGWLERVQRTRFHEWFHSYQHLIAGRFVPREVWRAARQFRPDLVFTIAGSWNWTAMMAQQVASGLGTPLVASFNDWFDYGIIVHPRFRRAIESTFRQLYSSCDLALCTSEGMRETLGPHPNSHVLYPLGTHRVVPIAKDSLPRPGNRRMTIAFAGMMGDWYGPMLERLVWTAKTNDAPIDFRFYGGNASWSRDFDAYARSSGIYCGHLPFDRLRSELVAADALILPMGFERDCEQVERTSFKTKFVDYLAYEKPILVWGPEYCSAVRVAREFDSAEICADPDAAAFLQTILSLGAAPTRRIALIGNARRMYDGRFNPDTIHSGLVDKCRRLVTEYRHAKR